MVLTPKWTNLVPLVCLSCAFSTEPVQALLLLPERTLWLGGQPSACPHLVPKRGTSWWGPGFVHVAGRSEHLILGSGAHQHPHQHPYPWGEQGGLL